MIINELILFTKNLTAQKKFYKEVLGFAVVLDSKEKVTFKTGKSFLSFEYKEESKPAHFAFNIPSGLINEAFLWLEQRVEILSDGQNKISNFVSWNAKAIYFYDADDNIVEFIARKNIDIKGKGSFSVNNILSISEIALVSNNLDLIFNSILEIRHIEIYDGNLNSFCALGNEEGLFILINNRVKRWHPTQEKAFVSDFVIKGDYNFSFLNGKIKELS